mgnify:CR=1 FL=1
MHTTPLRSAEKHRFKRSAARICRMRRPDMRACMPTARARRMHRPNTRTRPPRPPRAAYYLRASAAFSGYFLKNKKENKKSSCKTECIVI